MCAEVGLSGEIRPVSRIEQRIHEAEKLGFERIIISAFNKGIDKYKGNIEIITVKNIDDTIRYLFA